MPQGEHIELHRKRYGRQLDHEERTRKREARSVKKRAAMAQKSLGLKGKMFAKERAKEKATMKKTLAMHEERDQQHKADDGAKGSALPAYLLEREQVGAAGIRLCGVVGWGAGATKGGGCVAGEAHAVARCRRVRASAFPSSPLRPRCFCPPPCSLQVERAKVLSNTIKQKRKEKAGKWDVPLPKVRPVAEEEMFKVLRTGKRKKKEWKRMVTKVRAGAGAEALASDAGSSVGWLPAAAGGEGGVPALPACTAGVGAPPANAPTPAAAAPPPCPPPPHHHHHHHAGNVCAPGVHAQAAQVRALHPAHGSAHEQGARHAPRAQGHLPAGDHRREEEPQRPGLHRAGRGDQGWVGKGRVWWGGGHMPRSGWGGPFAATSFRDSNS